MNFVLFVIKMYRNLFRDSNFLYTRIIAFRVLIKYLSSKKKLIMIPLKDINPARRFPFVNITIIALNIIIFFYQSLHGQAIEQFIYRYALIPFNVTANFAVTLTHPNLLITFFTSLFLHGSFFHLAGNMLYLWVFGDNIEDKLGHIRFIIFYLLCGIVATAAHIAIDPTSKIPVIGASGAISGVLGAYAILFPHARVVTLIPIFIFIQLAELPALLLLGFWFVIQFLNGIVSLGISESGGVAWWAHIGGFIAGILIIKPMRRYK